MFGKFLVATITPFRGDGEIDNQYFPIFYPILEQNRVDTVVVFATNGEGPSLSLVEIDKTLKHVMDFRGNMEVVLGVFRTNTSETVKQMSLAEEYSVSGILLAPPFYFRDLSDEGLYHYFTMILNKTSIPVILYNIPKYTSINLTVNLIDKLSEYSQLVGIKDSSGDINQTSLFLKNFPDLKIYSGSDALIYQSLQTGCQGFITALGNVFPDLINDLIQKFAEKRLDEAQKNQEWLNKIRLIIKTFPQITSIKCCIERYLKLPPTFVRPPLINLDEYQKKEMFQSLDVLVHKKINQN